MCMHISAPRDRRDMRRDLQPAPMTTPSTTITAAVLPSTVFAVSTATACRRPLVRLPVVLVILPSLGFSSPPTALLPIHCTPCNNLPVSSMLVTQRIPKGRALNRRAPSYRLHAFLADFPAHPPCLLCISVVAADACPFGFMTAVPSVPHTLFPSCTYILPVFIQK